MSKEKFLIVVGGPTASGKTSFAIRLARHFDTAILSADSRQFYREMAIGTAKPSRQELEMATHYLIDSLSIEEEYSVGRFEKDALQLLSQLFQEKDVVILAGGSGLYIKALCEGLDAFPEVPRSIREEVEREYLEKGIEHLQQELARTDPDYHQQADLHNPHRLIRALAVCRASGKPFSGFRRSAANPRFFTPIYLQLHWPRQELYMRINKRVEQMAADGLLEEARRLYPRRELQALQTVGYQELFPHLEGRYDLNKAIELIQRNTRRYAKRQLTWYRRDGYWKLLHPHDWELAIRYLSLAMQEGFSLQHSEGYANGPWQAPSGCSGIEAKHFCFHRQGEKKAWMNYLHSRKECLLQMPLLKTGAPPVLAPLLAHQAILSTEKKNVFAISPEKNELFPATCVCKNASLQETPAWIRACKNIKGPAGHPMKLIRILGLQKEIRNLKY